jgi:hypothetical protein
VGAAKTAAWWFGFFVVLVILAFLGSAWTMVVQPVVGPFLPSQRTVFLMILAGASGYVGARIALKRSSRESGVQASSNPACKFCGSPREDHHEECPRFEKPRSNPALEPHD